MPSRRRTKVDPYRVARALNAVMMEGARPGFGNLRLLSTTADMLSARPEALPKDLMFDDSDDEVIRKVFEQVREGLAVDTFLADPRRAKRFATMCRRLGLKKPVAAINRRLLALRKRTGGGPFKPATAKARHGGLLQRFGPAVEAAMTKLRIRRGISVDDILADPELGDELESLATRMIAGGTPEDYRLCALQVRKARHLDKSERTLFEAIDPDSVMSKFESAEHFLSDSTQTQHDAGIVLLTESDRPIFLSRFDDVAQGAVLLSKAKLSTHLLADSQFWKAQPENSKVRYIPSSAMPGAPLRVYEFRLIRDLNPAFNWPMRDVDLDSAA